MSAYKDSEKRDQSPIPRPTLGTSLEQYMQNVGSKLYD